jgi:hypothetical protein
MSRYVRYTEKGGALVSFPCGASGVVVKLEEHHAKLHLHFFAEDDPEPLLLTETLARLHPTLRFTLYHESHDGYGTIHARNGRVEKIATKTKQP